MTFDLATRLDYLGTRMSELHDNSMTYRRGSTTITIENFNTERPSVEQLAIFGMTQITQKCQEFIFDTSELSTLDPALPQQGDEITWGSNTFTVMHDENAIAIYDFITSSRNRIRVYTKQTG